MLSYVQPDKLSPAQVAEILGIQKRTLRRWSVQFALALSPSAAAKGRKRFYSGSDVATFQRVQKLRDGGMRLSQIVDVLPVVPADENNATSLTLSPEASFALGQVTERAQRLTDEVVDHDDRLEKLEEWAKQSWWKKLTTKP